MTSTAASPPVASEKRLSKTGSGMITPTALTSPASPASPDSPLAVDEDVDEALSDFVRSDAPEAIRENACVVLGHGRFQRQTLYRATFALFVLLMHNLSYQVIGRPVDHWCRPPTDLKRLSPSEWKNMAIPLLPDGSFSKCTVYDPPIEDGTRDRKDVPCHSWEYDVKEEHDSIISKYNLVCENTWLVKLSTTVYRMGAVLLTPAAGALSDLLGRKPAIVASLWVMLCFTLFAGVSQSFLLFVLARFVVSASAHSTFLLLFILLHEVTGKERRALFTLVATALPITLTPRVIDAVNLLHPSWKVVQIVYLVPTLALTIWSSQVAESPIWLLATWKMRRAEQIVLAASQKNGVDQARAKVTFKLLKASMRKQDEALPTQASLGGVTVGRAFTGGQALSVALAWFYLTLNWYAFSPPLDAATAPGVAAYFLLQVVFYCATAWYLNNRGQREALFVSLVLCSAFTVLLAVTKFNGYVTVNSALALLAHCVGSSGASINYNYSAEVFPTVIRSIGMCCAFGVGRLGALSATLVALVEDPWTRLGVHLSLAVLALLCAVAVRWLPVVLVTKKPGKAKQRPAVLMSDCERKEAIKKSLSSGRSVKNADRRRKSGRQRGRMSSETAASPSSVGTPIGSPSRRNSLPVKSPVRQSPRKRNANS